MVRVLDSVDEPACVFSNVQREGVWSGQITDALSFRRKKKECTDTLDLPCWAREWPRPDTPVSKSRRARFNVNHFSSKLNWYRLLLTIQFSDCSARLSSIPKGLIVNYTSQIAFVFFRKKNRNVIRRTSAKRPTPANTFPAGRILAQAAHCHWTEEAGGRVVNFCV